MSLFGARVDLAPALAEARRSIEMLSETVKLLREQNADLLARYHALKLAGAVPEPKASAFDEARATASRLLGPPDELKALIHEQAGTDYRKRGMMLRQLTADRAAGRSDDAIRREIENGVQADGVAI